MGFNPALANIGVSNGDQGDTLEISKWDEYEINEPKEGVDYKHQECPKCSQTTLFADRHTGDFLCEYCNYSGNIFETKLSKKLNAKKQNVKKNWWSEVKINDKMKEVLIEKYSITEDTIEKLQITTQRHYFKSKSVLKSALVIPAFDENKTEIVNYYFIPVSKDLEIEDYFETLNGELLGLDTLINKPAEKPLYFVNSPLDYLSMRQTDEHDTEKLLCISSNIDTINIGDNKQWDFLKDNEKIILSSRKFITLFPVNEINEKIKNELCRRIGFHLCGYIKLNDFEDDIETKNFETLSISDILHSGHEEAVRAVIDDPFDFPIKGLHQLKEYEEEMDDIFHNGLNPGYSLGYKQLDPYLTVKFGQWTLVTGIPGQGKSSFVEACLINMAALHDFKIALFSPENTPLSRFYISLIQKASGKSYSKVSNNSAPKITAEEHEYWKEWFHSRFFSILPDEDLDDDDFSITGNKGSLTLPGILSLAAKAVFRHGVKIVAIDPWTDIDHARPAGMTELEYLSAGISLIKRFAKRYDVHVIIVAHPTKMLKDANGRYPVPTPYNIAGGAHWRNKGDNIISIYRNVGEEDEDITDIYIQKIRFKEVGQVGSFSIRADKITNFYYDDIDQDKRLDIIIRQNNGSGAADFPSVEEVSSHKLRLSHNYNLRELPAQFAVKNEDKVIETDFSYTSELNF